MAAVAFDSTAFQTRYPVFSAVDPSLLAAYFLEACMHCNNTESSQIRDLGTRSLILNMIVAHLIELEGFPMVGRVSDVTVGGIPVHTMYAPPTGTRAWYDQTKYGASAWVAMGPYRRALYVAPDPSY